MSRSILDNVRECYITRQTQGLHKHHIFFGTGQRKLSEEWGCWCYLTGSLHNQSNEGVHFNLPFRLAAESATANTRLKCCMVTINLWKSSGGTIYDRV